MAKANRQVVVDVHHGERSLLPMLIGGLALVIAGGIIIMSFV
jgi:hypothetical protein